jgi:hypothetical protein
MVEGRHSNIQMRQLKKELRFALRERNVLGIDRMRHLVTVLLDRDEETLGIWSTAVLAAGSGE